MRRRKFEHALLEFEDLKTVSMHDRRYYELPNGTLAWSVTTVLGHFADKSALMEWKAKVGEDEAKRISTQAASRGTAIHNICERYLLNEDSYPERVMPTDIETFQTVRPLLDENIGKVYGIEAPLYSYELAAAGRTDCIAEWNGIPSIIDFKTSRKLKKEEWIENYFLQATTYSLMAEERTELKVPQIVVLIAVDNEQPQVFVKSRENYVEKVLDIFGRKR